MSRLIDADTMMKAMYHRAFETHGDAMWQSGCWVRYRAIEQVVIEQPTAEPKKGEWKRAYLDREAMGERPSILYCSIWNQCIAYPTNYCPNCGADMRGDEA